VLLIAQIPLGSTRRVVSCPVELIILHKLPIWYRLHYLHSEPRQ